MPKRKYILTSTCGSCVRPTGPLASGSSPTLTRPEPTGSTITSCPNYGEKLIDGKCVLTHTAYGQTTRPPQSAHGDSGVIPTRPEPTGSTLTSCPNYGEKLIDGKCVLTHTAYGQTTRPPQSAHGDSGVIPTRPPTTPGSEITCRSGECIKPPSCGGGTIDFQTGIDSSWTGAIVNGECDPNGLPVLNEGSTCTGEGFQGVISAGKCVKSCTGEVAIEGTNIRYTFNGVLNDGGVCWSNIKQGDPFSSGGPFDPYDAWNFRASGSTLGPRIMVCDNQVIIPEAFSVRKTTNGVFIRDGAGVEVPMVEFCKKPPCVYSNTDYTGVLTTLGEEPVLVLKDLLDKASIKFPSLDGYVCDHDKIRILNNITEVLADIGNINDNLDVFLPSWLATLVGDFPAVDYYENIAQIARAAIEFGRGNFSTVILSLLQALPSYGGDQLITKLIESSGLNLEVIDNSLTAKQKEKIIDGAQVYFSALAFRVPPAAPVLAVVQALILLGERKWDESLEAILTLGIGKLLGRLLKPLLDKVKELSDKLDII